MHRKRGKYKSKIVRQQIAQCGAVGVKCRYSSFITFILIHYWFLTMSFTCSYKYTHTNYVCGNNRNGETVVKWLSQNISIESMGFVEKITVSLDKKGTEK